ncbi:MAG: ATP-binding cassette domain-containing protein [Lachnospiraceae bacterium]|nr:ATP-binding cassette domain-containing protein [Lachnospiraceae bacterium]
MEPYIEIEHVTKRFKEDIVLHDVSVAMERGKVYGFSGNNGSGKTVLMKCICGFLPVSEGKVRVNGKVVGREIDFPESIGVIIETPGFLTNLTGVRNLEILAALRGKIGRKEIEQAVRKAGLDPSLKKAVSKYSLGMRQRLGIAQAIMEDPEFLILDEPFNGLDKHGVADIRNLLLDLKEQGKTIILASHNSADIRILCDKVFEMDGGRMREL